MKETARRILDELAVLFPDAGCELDYATPEQLAIAVILSAQTTDISVNKVTPKLHARFENLEALANGDIEAIEDCIRSIGLYRNKAKNIKAFAQELIDRHEGHLPSDAKSLCALSGIGQKTANVIQAVAFHIPALAVDTHVHRVSMRLGLVKKTANVTQAERQLKRVFPQDKWIEAHHQLLFFGRYLCQARKPQCERCPFFDLCTYEHKKK